MARTTDHLRGLSAESERRLERLFAEFDAAWKRGARPRIIDHLTTVHAEEHRATLVELVFIDLEYSIKSDSSSRLESYLGKFPELATEPDLILDLAAHEYLLRERFGDRPTVKEYVDRFPNLGPRLAARLGRPNHGDSVSDDEDATVIKPASPIHVANSIPDGLPDEGPPRYRQIRTHARGGLGEVFLAEDVVLHREVALKRILPHLANDAAVRQRFLREAEITARLDHPGVAPIHELIFDKKNQPWYVMRFVRGRTFRAEIEKFYKLGASTKDADRSVAFRNLVGRFVSACETMAYAHRRGVVHRDLTPSNVMLGTYGETIVLDWGLATASGDPDDAVTGTRPISSPPDVSLFVSGQLLGTPAFMSPEQAAAHQSAVGPVSDVYCLGAILYMLLAGKPPFQDRNLATVLANIQKGEFPPPRQIRSEVPAALEAICLKAMSLKQEDRYQDARSLAHDVERWLADEPVAAYGEPLRLRARRWAKKHRTWVVASAASIAVAAVLLGSWRVSVLRQRWRQESLVQSQRLQQENEARDDIAQAERLGAAAEADSASDRSRKDAIAKYSEAISLTERAQGRLAEATGTSDLHRRAEEARDRLQKQKADLALELGLESAQLLAASVKQGQFDTLAKVTRYKTLFREHGLAPDGFAAQEIAERIRAKRQRLRDLLVAVLDDWAWELRFDERSRSLRSNLAAIAYEADANPQSTDFRKAMLERDTANLTALAFNLSKNPNVPATRLHTVGNVLYWIGKPLEAAKFLREAQQTHPGDFAINLALGNILTEIGAPHDRDADRYLSAALAIQPESYAVHLSFGNIHLARGETDLAIDWYGKAATFTTDSPQPDYALGYLAWKNKDYATAIARFRKATTNSSEFAEAHNALVSALAGPEGDWDLAIADYRKRVELDGKNAGNHYGLGIALHAKNEVDEAIKEFRKTTELRPEFGEAHQRLGTALLDTGKRDEAIAELQRAVSLSPKSPLTHFGLASALREIGDKAGVIRESREAIRLKPDFAEAHWELGLCLEEQHQYKDALIELKRGRELGSKNPVWQLRYKDWAETIAHTERVLDVQRRLPELIAGKAKIADQAERLIVAQLCYDAKLYATATRFWVDAFAADPSCAVDCENGNRYNAACSAALAGTGKGEDESPPDVEARKSLRQMALDWLKADLDAWRTKLENGTVGADLLRERLGSWKEDADLAGVREAADLDKLSEPDRAAWRALWAETDKTIARSSPIVSH